MISDEEIKNDNEGQSVPIPIDRIPALDTSDNIPLYVSVYEVLNELIEKGEIQPCQSIPSELELSHHWDVSKGTVRRALRLLVEDGKMIKSQGKNTQAAPSNMTGKEGIQFIVDVCDQYCLRKIDAITMEYEYTGASVYTADLLDTKRGELLLLAHLSYYAQGECVAYSQRFVPTQLMSTYNVDANDPDAIQDFVLSVVTQEAKLTSSSIFVISADEELPIDGKADILLFDEVYCTQQGMPIAIVKSYLCSDSYHLTLQRRQ